MDTTTILHGPGQLLAAIPVLLGYVPRESVVVVSLRDKGEVGVLLRVDRADCLDSGTTGPLSRSVAAHLARDGAREAILVSYTTADVRLACPALDALRPAIVDAVGQVEGWAVVAARYFAPGCARESCCPVRGRPVPTGAEIEASRVRAGGHGHGGRGAEPDARVEVDEPARKRSTRAGERWLARRATDVAAWRRRSLAMWDVAATGAAVGRMPSATDAGKIVAALQDRRVRDAVLVSFLPGGEKVAAGVVDGTGDDEVSGALRVLLSPDEGRRPDRASLVPLWDLLGFLTAHARTRQRAPTLTLCAVLAWWEGDAEACQSLLARAHAAEPGYRLAGLLECTVLAGIDPGWKRAA